MTDNEKQFPILIVLVSLAHAVTDLSQGALFVALPYLKAKFSLTYAQVSFITLMSSLTASVSQPLFGYFSDRKYRPWLMVAGCVSSGVAMTAALLSTGYWWCVALTALSGFGVAIFHPEAAKAINRLSGAARGKGVSHFVVGGNAGFALGSLWLAMLLSQGQGANLLLYALPCVFAGIMLQKMIDRLPEPVTTLKSHSKLRIALQWPLFALLGTVLIRATVSTGISTFIPLYYISHLQGNELYASSLVTVYLAAGAIGTLFGGRLSDRLGSKRVMLWSILPVSVLVYVLHLSPGIWIFAALALASALLSAAFASSLVLAQLMMPGNIGMASGLTIGLSVGLGGMGVLALGKAADIWGLPIVFDILAILPVFGFLLTMFVKDIAQGGAPRRAGSST